MKNNTIFKPLSDLHIDVAKFHIPEMPEDKDTVLLLAGDIAEGKAARNFIEPLTKRFKLVVYCLGNHEFFNREYHAHVRDWEEAAGEIPNFHFLHDDCIVVDDVRIMGGCLWTDFNGGDWFASNAAKHHMNDFHKIRILDDLTTDSRGMYVANKRVGRKFHPDDARAAHSRTVAFLGAELAKPWEGKTIIMSHHLPSELSVNPRFRLNNTLNYAYYSSLEWIMEKYRIDVWLHGHTHHSVDYHIDHVDALGNGTHRTRVISNARGYVPYETPQMTGFNPLYTFEV